MKATNENALTKNAVAAPQAATTDGGSAGVAWAKGISKEWAEELADSSQDIYTLADGEPVDETR